MSITPEIPGTRKPFEDKKPLISKDKHPLASFFYAKPRWHGLPQYFRTRVLDTTKELYLLSGDEVLQRAKDLDEEILISPYLANLVQHGGTLMDQNAAMSDIFAHQAILDEADYDKLSPRVTQINLAGRLIGRRIEKEFGWDPANGFGEFSHEAQIAINLCREALQEVAPPNL